MIDEERGYALQLPDEMETERLHPGSSHGTTLAESDGIQASHSQSAYSAAYGYATDRVQEFWDRLRGKGRRKVGWGESLKNIATSSGK